MPVLSGPEVDADLVGGTFVVAAALLAAPHAIGLVLESAVLASTDRAGRRSVLAGALAAMSLGTLLVSVAHGPLALAVSLGIWGTAAGIAEATGEAALVGDAADADRAMTRAGLSAALGDLLAPALVGIFLASGGSWRMLMAFTALVPAAIAIGVARGPALHVHADDDAPEPLWTALRDALRDRRLLGWLLAATACTLMDEILVGLVALRLDSLGASPVLRGAELSALAVGAAAGLLATDRWLPSAGSRAVLLASCGIASVALPAWLALGASPLGIVALALLGVGVGPMFPLATAAAYAGRPGRPGLVGALENGFAPLEILAPLVVGWVADRLGLEAAILALLLQPATVAAVAWSRP